MDRLSTEIIFDILKLLTHKDILLNCVLVSKEWKNLINSQYFYKYLCNSIYPLSKLKSKKNYRKTFEKFHKKYNFKISHIVIQYERELCINGCDLCKQVNLKKVINGKKLYQEVCAKSSFPPHRSLIYKIDNNKVSIVLNDSTFIILLSHNTKILIINQYTEELVRDMERVFKSYGITGDFMDKGHFQS
jgi:hypothetical protein